jgi:hypothetical protein
MKRALFVGFILPFLFVCKILETRNPASEGNGLCNVTIAIDAVPIENTVFDIMVYGDGMDRFGPERFGDSDSIRLELSVGSARRFCCSRLLNDGTVVDTGTVISDIDNNVHALTIKLTPAIDKPSITSHPKDRVVAIGEPAVFEVAAAGKGVLLQWQRNSKNIAGATSARYSFIAAESGDDGTLFRCILTNPAGSDTSDAAVLHVCMSQAPDTTRPVITLIGGDTVEIRKDDPFNQLKEYLKVTSIKVTDAGGGPVIIREPFECNVNVFTASATPYWIKYTATDTSGNSTTATRYVLVVDLADGEIDTKPPWMSIADDTLYLIRGDSFVDPGVTAFDLHDGDLSSKVTVTGTVTSEKTGTYMLIYSVTDSAGNTALKQRVVIVVPTVPPVDNVPPVITLIGPDTLYLPSGQTIDTYVFIEPGYTATDNIDGDLTDKVVRTERKFFSIEFYYYEYTVEDAARNPAIPRRRFINTGTKYVPPPAIDLTFPDSIIRISKGGTWKEPGYHAFDSDDGDITARVIVNDTNVTNNIHTEGIYRIVYTVTNSRGITSQSVRYVTVVGTSDIAVPQITLLGRNPDTVLTGSAPQYPEPGYVATDNEAGDLTAEVIMSGTVNMKVPGKYTVTYMVSDEAANKAFTTRTVWVVRDTSGLSLAELYQVPSVHPLPSLLNKTYTTYLVDGDGPDLSTIIKLGINWDSTTAQLRAFSLQYKEEPYYKSFSSGITQSFSEPSPKMKLSGSMVPGLDGEYYVTVSGTEFIWVETGGVFAIIWQE